MKHNTCPHCGVRISLRQRIFAKKGELSCVQCGAVSCYRPTAGWFCGYVSIFYPLFMLGQYWASQPWWWCVPVIMAVAIFTLSAYWPIVQKREVTRSEKIGRVLLRLGVFVIWNILLVLWMNKLDALRDSQASEMRCPPATQSAHCGSE